MEVPVFGTPQFWNVVASFIALFLVPLVVSLLKSAKFPTTVNLLIAYAVSFAAAIASLGATGAFKSWDEAMVQAAVIMAGAIANYEIWFKNLSLNEKLTNTLWG